VTLDEVQDLEIRLLLEAVYQRYGYDFRNYARPTLRRRVLNMVQEQHLSSVSALQERVLRDPVALDRLTWHIAVNATSMFRDPGCFLSLRKTIVPRLRELPFFRIWHAGCATGEEVYSMAILLTEEGLYDRARIYATDMSGAALEQARTGIYSLRLMQEFTENHLRAGGLAPFSSFYAARYEAAIFKRELRRNVHFAQHNLVVDRSFNEFQLILCRNVLIYFEPELQRRVHQLLLDSLSPGGFLVLGRSEALPAPLRASYVEVDAREKIFERTPPPGQPRAEGRARASGDADARDGQQHLAQEHQ
jgi:chemotaxis protein methyltransferase CheR